ncbi:ABC transporter substrate-binding protein [Jiangella asiatica]|uniref:ABC transporter substrate-binding protein n=1 Tax=Jiangella asiatica TaxID=2530372 RepID=A0A4R5CLB1_9ACTN|nr:ABC transporter substrate-binding protein [Jiangella asiatica]
MTIATGRYDRTAALHDGRIRPEGLEITWLPLNVEQIFWRMMRHREFDASELSLSGYLIRRARGVDDLVPIPVFLSRCFRHSAIYLSAASGITKPEELAGRRIGVPEYQITAAVWARGLLHDEHGVDARDVRWVQGGLEQPGRRPFEPVEPDGVDLSFAPEDATLAGMLADGEIDALISPRVPSTFSDGSGRVTRLFPDPGRAERDYYRRTGIFPIMHIVAISRDIVDANPWVPQTLTSAFLQAKQVADAALRDTTALPIQLPFLVEHVQETVAVMGEDFWSYGVEANRATLEAFVRYAHVQGLLPEPVDVDDIFPASVRKVSRV